jgi:hypothetical protein
MSLFASLFKSLGRDAMRSVLGEPVALAYQTGSTVNVTDAVITRLPQSITLYPDGRRIARELTIKVAQELLPTPPGSPVATVDGLDYDTQVSNIANGFVWFRATRPELTERAASDYRQKRI